jgi:energy-coupling factor transporter ATP-binding protein EcfA2
MKLKHLWIDNYCSINFATSDLLTAIIGLNGSGKSNLIEAILHILIGVYFKKAPPFDFNFQFESQQRHVTLQGQGQKLSVEVDGIPISIEYFTQRLRDGPSQVYYPELTFVYYSGDCNRVRRLVKRYQTHFHKLTRDPESHHFRPLFVESSNQQAQIILLALFAHNHQDFLKNLSVQSVVNVSLVLRSPDQFNPERDEPKLWGTKGLVGLAIAAIDATGEIQSDYRTEKKRPADVIESLSYTETRTYFFSDDKSGGKSIHDLAARLAKDNDNLYLVLENLRARGILQSVEFKLIGRDGLDLIEFDHLSEGEKQLIAVVGAIHLTNQSDNLVLLDEPDTHLNPRWSWEYPQMLEEAFTDNQRQRSSVLMTTHDPVMISGLLKEQVLIAQSPIDGKSIFANPRRNPRGQGVANILCSSEFFGLPSSLDKETQKLLDERLKISIKPKLSPADKARLRELSQLLEIITPGVSERDPQYVAFLRQKYGSGQE